LKVINRNDTAYYATCLKCSAELEFTKEDVSTGEFGCAYVTCPVCGEKVNIENEELYKKLTIDNIQFPQDFHYGENAVHIKDEEVNKFINQCLKDLEGKNEEYGIYSCVGTGDTKVMIFKYEDEYDVIVTQNYYKTSIFR